MSYLATDVQNYLVESDEIIRRCRFRVDVALTEDLGTVFGMYRASIMVRVLREEVQFCHARNFDRWANSLEYVYYGLPRVEDWPVLLEEASRICAENSDQNAKYGSGLDITPLLRRRVRRARF